MECSICTVYTFSDFFIVCKLYQSGLQIIYYILEVSRQAKIDYIEGYLVLTEIERLFSPTCYFVSYFLTGQ